jgi:hypothetical protein
MPARFGDIARAVKAFGATVEEPPSGGSHYKVCKGGAVFPITAHNGLKSEISNIYLRGLCRFLGCTLDDFKKEL